MLNLFKDNLFSVKINGLVGDFFPKNKGLNEGSPLSPILFIYAFETIQSRVQEIQLERPILLCDRDVRTFLFADDIAVVASNVQDLIKILREVFEFCEMKGYQINSGKSELVVFRRHRRAVIDCVPFGRDTVVISKVVRYLGIFFSDNNSWEAHKTIAYKRANSLLFRSCQLARSFPNCSLNQAITFFDSVTASVFQYGIVIWGFGNLARFDAIYCRFFRFFFSLPKRTRGSIILGESCRLCCACIAAQARFFLFFQNVERDEFYFFQRSFLQGCG